MAFDADIHRRRSIRLQGYDYAGTGAYLVTIVAHGRSCLFGEVAGGKMRVNALGKILREEWFRSAEIRREVELHPAEFVVMPNHLHGIIWFTSNGNQPALPPARGDIAGPHGLGPHTVGAHGRAPAPRQPLHRAPRSLGAFIAGFKSSATKRISILRQTRGVPVWQRNYYEHVIRDEESLRRIRQYILDNPVGWEFDRENPEAPVDVIE